MKIVHEVSRRCSLCVSKLKREKIVHEVSRRCSLCVSKLKREREKIILCVFVCEIRETREMASTSTGPLLELIGLIFKDFKSPGAFGFDAYATAEDVTHGLHLSHLTAIITGKQFISFIS